MLVLTIRTDKPDSELGLYEDDQKLAYEVWPAHRQLAETIHGKIDELLQSRQATLQDIRGIVCFQGPGSFTGLRIGLSVGNALAYSEQVPIVASQSEQWIPSGIQRLLDGETDVRAMPFYGADVYITQPKK